MQDKMKEQLQGVRSDFSKNQQLYVDSKNKDVQNPEKKKNPINQSEDEADVDTTKPTWHHGEEVDKSEDIDPLRKEDGESENDEDDFEDEIDFEDEEDFEDEDDFDEFEDDED